MKTAKCNEGVKITEGRRKKRRGYTAALKRKAICFSILIRDT